MRGPSPTNSSDQKFQIAKDGDYLSFRSVPSSKISQDLSDHYKENPGELSENRNFSFTYTNTPGGKDEYELKVYSKQSDTNIAFDRDQQSIPISIDKIKDIALENEKKRQEIKQTVLNFFKINPNQSLDKEFYYNTISNSIITDPDSSEIQAGLTKIIISPNTKEEINRNKKINSATINYFVDNPNETKNIESQSFYYDENSNSVTKESNNSSPSDKFQRITISQAEKDEIEKTIKIRNLTIEFFIQNINESFDSKDRIVVYDGDNDTIKTKAQSEALSPSEKSIKITDKTKYEITRKRLEKLSVSNPGLQANMAEGSEESPVGNLSESPSELQTKLQTAQVISENDKKKISRLEHENRSLALANSSLRSDLETAKEKSNNDEKARSQLESEKGELILLNSELQNKLKMAEEKTIESKESKFERNESNILLQKLEKALGININEAENSKHELSVIV